MRFFRNPSNRINISEAANGNGPNGGETPAGAGNNREPDAGISASKMLRNIRGIIFDFDGTLFDNALLPFYLIAAYPPDILRLRNERLIRKDFAGRDYLTPEAYYRSFFTALGKACFRPPEKIRLWYYNRFMPHMVKILRNHYRARPGAQELLRLFGTPAKDRDESPASRAASSAAQLSAPRIAVYSDYPCLKERLEALDICTDPGILLYGPESFGAQKPAARPFREIAGALGARPEEVLVIGDREETDGIGAFKAGMRFFCLETGRKHYFRLDPYRKPSPKEEPHGPSLLMYAGPWDHLYKLLVEKYG